MDAVDFRAALLARIVDAARDDARIAGVLDYGSSGEGRADEWSDIDLALFARDEDVAGFLGEWKEWAAQFGDLLLAYVGRYGHPWAVYRRPAVPLRVDFDVIPESRAASVAEWENSPTRGDAMVLYDDTDRTLTAAASRIVGKSLRPADPQAAFESECGDFWYFALFVYCKLQRGEYWGARQVFHSEVLDHLLRLLRLEAGGPALDHWRWKQNAFGVERTLSTPRLARLDDCAPERGPGSLRRALAATVAMGAEVSAAIAVRERWPWPEELAADMRELLAG